ncbi:MAG: SusC/RagA family TonB-linked outer membrane protein [Sphingobacterium sp.]
MNFNMYKSVGLALFSLCTTTAFAQQQVTGTVTGAKGPIVGVTVSIKGTTKATQTDKNGRFSIQANSGETLHFSMVGYAAQDILIGSNKTLAIQLAEGQDALEEVVVTAMGIKREKRALGYAMTEISGDEIANANTVSPINAMQGKVAGVQINMGNSGPQSSQRILIRGNTSISGNNQPIFVIDGVIIDNETTKTTEKLDRDFGNDLKNLNSDDFETVSILKGAAATALYGSRASNGVILITTKKGKKGQGLGISFSHTEQFETLYAVPKLQNKFGEGTQPVWGLDGSGKDIRNVDAGNLNFGPAFDGLEYTANGGVYKGIYKAYENNLKDFYRTGRYQNSNIALSNGTDKSSYRFSYSRLATKGISPNNEFDRHSFSLNASHEINKYIKATGGFNYVNNSGKNPTYQGEAFNPIFDFLYSVPRSYDTKYWLNNYENNNRDGWNNQDLWGYSEKLYDYLKNNQLQNEQNYRANLNLDFKINDWLSFLAKGDFYKLYTTNELKRFAQGTSAYAGAKYEITNRSKDQYRYGGQINANHRFSNINMTASLGAERWNSIESMLSSSTQNGLLKPGLFDLTNSVGLPTTKGRKNYLSRRINSVYGFLNFDWKNQVYLDITGRNDWSSTLMYTDGSGNVSYFYPSVTLSWILSDTFRDKLPKAISFAKLRGSYAIVGKDTDPYFLTTAGSYKFIGLFDGSYPYYGFANDQLGARNLKPEKQYASEFGLEMKFLNNRLGLDFAYYKSNTKNQILALETAPESGVRSKLINAGNIQNQGIELLINGTPVKSENWNWDLSVNLTRNRNKIIELTDGVPVYRLPGGGAETNGYATVGGAYGDIYSSTAYLRDAQGNKMLTADGVFVRSGINKKIGSLQPDFLGGFNSVLRYKNFTLNTLLDARFGGDILSSSFNYGMNNGTLASSLQGRTSEYGGLARKLPDGRIVNDGMIPDGYFQSGTTINGQDVSGKSYQWAVDNGLKEPLPAATYYNNLYSWGSGIREAAIFKSSWVSLREIAVSYRLPNKLFGSFFKSSSVGFSVRNVAYLYNSLPDNINPEGLATTYGSEYKEGGGAPLTRNYSIRLNVTF